MSDREPTTMDDLSSSTVSSVGSGYAGIQNGSRRLPKVFDFHSGRKCPTCGGTGKIPKGQRIFSVELPCDSYGVGGPNKH